MRKIYVSFLTVLIFLLTSLMAKAQLTGTKNIPGDYADLATAITALNTQGVGAGGVTLNLIAANPQTAPAGGYVIGNTGSLVLTTSSAANPVIIQGNGNTITASGSLAAGALNDAIFKLIGADWVTITGFVMNENAANTTTTAASNNMTEWGVALLYVTATDGAQNNTIQNNTIDLNRTYQNTFGIYSNSTHTATTISTTASATGANGGNSGLKIYSNIITDVNNGIVVVGPTAAADFNNGVDIGGSSLATGNSITNFGTTGTFSSYVNVSGTVNGILVRNTNNFNISYNTITSSNGGVTSGTTNGIQLPAFSVAPTGTFTNTINHNTISVKSAAATGAINGINSLGTSASATSSLSISNNNFTDCGHTVAASGAILFINNKGTHQFQDITNNTFTNISVNTTGAVTFIDNDNSLPAGGTKNVSNNAIVTGFTKTGAAGAVKFITDGTSGVDVNGSSSNFINNTVSNITLTGTTGAITFFECINGAGTTNSPNKTVKGNTINNVTGGTGAIICLVLNWGSGADSIHNNTFGNITNGGAITGISTLTSGTSGPTSSWNFFRNNIHSFTGSGTGAVTGMSISGATGATGRIVNIYKNKIYGLENSNAGGTVSGVTLVSGANISVYNNLIGDLRAPAATTAGTTDAIRGINITSTTTLLTIKVAYNTIYLNASSSGANFFTSGIFHTTSATATTSNLTLNNNIIINKSTPNGTGTAVAYRRSSTALTNYNAASNNNLFYAGTPSATNLIFSDGTNTYSDITGYTSFMNSIPADQASVTEDVLFQSTTGSNADFLKYDLVAISKAEAGAENITGITDDYIGTIRQGNPGYLGSALKPDIGAWELNGAQPSCSGTPAASNTVASDNPACFGQPLTLSLSQTYLGVTYKWQSSPDGVSYSDIPSANAPVYLTTGTVTTWYQCIITCNGNNTTSTPLQVVVNPPMAGVYTINNLSATGGTNFNNFDDAITALNCRGISAAVTFNVSAGQTFNEASNLILTIQGTAVNTITFQKSGAGVNPRIIRTGTSGTSDYVLRLDGADYITFDGIDIDQAGGSASDWVEFGIYITNASVTNGASNNTFKNATVSLSNANSGTRCVNVTSPFTPTAASGTNSNNRFLNMTLQNSFYGYRFAGATNSFLDNGNEVNTEASGTSLVQNLGDGVTSADIYGVFSAYQAGFKVSNTSFTNFNNGGTGFISVINAQTSTANDVEFSNNTVSNITSGGNQYLIQVSNGASADIFNNTVSAAASTATAAGIRGVYIQAPNITANIYGNKIFNLSSSGITGTTVAGIEITSGSASNIYNNMISDLRAPASTTTTGGTRGISVTGATTGGVVRIYYNTVLLEDIGTVAAYTSAGILNSSTTPTLDIRNNVIINRSEVSGGTRAAAFWKTSTTDNVDNNSNNNLYYCGAPGPKNLIYYDGTNSAETIQEYNVLAAITPGESLSITENSVFAPIVNGVIRPATGVPTLIESGGQVIATYTTDFENTPRGPYPLAGQTNGGGVSPDLGADEGDFNYILPVVPGCPTLDEPINTAADVCASANATLKWTPATTGGLVTLGYDVYFGTNPTPPFVANTNSTSYPVTGLLPNTTYYWKIVPKNAVGSAVGCATYSFTTINAVVSSTTPASRCGIGTVNLSASGNGTLNWYNAASGGSPIFTGPVFTTPVISNTTTYYVSASSGNGTATAGKPHPQDASSGFNGNDYGLVFEALQPFTLVSVDVYPTTATGSIVVELVDNGGTVIQSAGPFTMPMATGTTYAGGATPYTLALNFDIQPGTNYKLRSSAHSGNLIRDNPVTGFTYPSPIGTFGNLTSGWLGGSANANTYYYFFNILASSGCETARVPVTATVNPAPAVNTSATNMTVCAGEPTQLNATSANAGYSYVWNPGNLAGASPTVSPTEATTYTVTATDNSGGANDGCVNTATINIAVNPKPSPITITPSGGSFCSGAPAQLLTASGGTNTIQMNSGTQANQNAASTGATGYPAPYTVYYGGQRMQMLITAAELTAAGFTAGTPISNIEFPVASLGANWGGSLAACQDFQVSVGHTALTTISAFQTGLTQVVAPGPFTPTVGYNNTHVFSTPFVWDGTSNIIVETTFSNNLLGSAADVAIQYNSPTAFQSTIVYRADNVTSTAAAAATTVSFSYSARPDFKLNALLSAPITWSPTTNLYTDALATIPYAGGNAASVYALPVSTQTYTATATNGSNCTNTATATVTIVPPPSATISYAGSPYCSNAGTATVTHTGSAGGTYTSTAGLVINSGTGAINLAASTAGTYTVTYTVAAANGCPQFQTTAPVTIVAAPNATISYVGSPYCSGGGTANVALTGTTGGTFTSTAGLSIDGTTGAINLGASSVGTYTVTYTIAAGACAEYQTTATVSITTSPSATISYAGSPYCSNGTTATVTQSGSTGGTYSSTAGLSIDASTGAVNIATSTPGTYTVTYSIAAAGGCSAFQTTTGITITALPAATISYAGSPYCSNAGTANVTRTGTAGGTYASTAGLSINSSTGAINLGASTAGTYTVTYTIAAANGCGQVQTTTSVTITSAPSAIIAYGGSPYCGNAGTANVSRTGTAGGTYSSTAGLSINASTGAVNLAASTPGTYTVSYTLAATGGCAQFVATTSITITVPPAATISYAGSPYCSNGGTATVTHSGTTGGAYSSTAGLSINTSTGAVNLGTSTPGTYTVTYTIAAANGCAQVTATAPITINPAPVAAISYAGSPYCGNAGTATVTQTGNSGGTYTSAAGLSINASTGAVNLAASTPGTYTVTYTIAAANGCAQLQVTAPITITPAPTATIAYAGSPYCSSAGTANVTHTGTTGGTYTAPAGLSINASTGAVNLATSTAGTYTVTYTVAAANGCAQFQATTSITITTAPAATIAYTGSPFCITAGTINVTRTGTAGGTYTSTAGLSINASTGAITTGTSTPGTYTVTYTIAAAGGCAQLQATTSITIVSSGTWMGSVSTDWNNAANWCGGIPTSTSDVVIPSTAPNMPNLSGANGTVRNITINNGATVTIGAGGILDLYGNISGAGTFNAAAGNISFRGATPQTLPAFTANNVTMNGAGGVTPGGNSTITGTLLLIAGNITLGSNNLTLNNTSTGSPASHIITNGTGVVIAANLAASQARAIPIGVDAASYNPVTLAANPGHTTDNFNVRVLQGVYENGVSGTTFTTHVSNRTWIINEGAPGGSNVNVTLQWAGSEELTSFDRTKCYVMQHNGTQWVQGTATAATGTDPYTQTKLGVTSFSPFAVQTQPIPRPVTGIYPNPVRTFMNVVTDNLSTGPTTFSVFDAKGSLVYKRTETLNVGLNQTRLELAHLSSGVYTLRVTTRLNDKFLVARFVKVN